MANTARIDVRHWSSTCTDRPSMARCSEPIPSVTGRRPTVTSTASAASECSVPSASVKVSASPSRSSSSLLRPPAVAPRWTVTPSALSRADTGRVSTSSYCGRIRDCSSTTVTSLPSLR